MPGDSAQLRNPFEEYIPYENSYALGREYNLVCEECGGQGLSVGGEGGSGGQVKQVVKELVEVGVMTVVSHVCESCNRQLCILCGLTHKQRHPNHKLKGNANMVPVASMMKKGDGWFEEALSLMVTERIRDSIDCEISKLTTTLN